MNWLFLIQYFFWIHEPKTYTIGDNWVQIITEPNTDYWSNTHYGFIHDNAPSYVRKIEGDFTFTVKAQFNSKQLYDQAGIVLYQDSENWLKASIEYQNTQYSRLGSVVTNLGYSDWSFQDFPSNIKEVYYRLSRKGQDFLFEYSIDGISFTKIRITHMHIDIKVANVGVYACSPLESSFTATFQDFKFEDNIWIDD